MTEDPNHREVSVPEDPRTVLRRHGLRPKRSWSQNFLVNLALVERIADAAAESGADQAIEIGAGLGTLTSALSARMPRVLAIERDRQLAAILRQESRDQRWTNVELIEADAQTFDYRAAIDRPTVIVGNLPYHLTGRLFRRIIEVRDVLSSALVMVQLEVAHRLISTPGTKSYGILSVMCQGWFEPILKWRVSPGSFHPKPKVGSAVVLLLPLLAPRAAAVEELELSRVVNAAFATRRKTLRNTLCAAFPKTDVLSALAHEGIDPGLRAEALTVEQLAALTRRLLHP